MTERVRTTATRAAGTIIQSYNHPPRLGVSKPKAAHLRDVMSSVGSNAAQLQAAQPSSQVCEDPSQVSAQLEPGKQQLLSLQTGQCGAEPTGARFDDGGELKAWVLLALRA